MATKQFKTGKRKTRTITFDLDEDEYHFNAPKLASVMLPVLDSGSDNGDEAAQVSMGQATWDWLREGLGDEQYGRIRERLTDTDDDLDVGDVADVARWLVGQVTGRPTS